MADEQEDVGDVEDPGEDLGRSTRPGEAERKFPPRQHVQKIPHRTDRHAVVEIAEAAREDQADASKLWDRGQRSGERVGIETRGGVRTQIQRGACRL